MSTITIGRSVVPLEHIALVEHFDLAANPRLKTERPFQSRVVLLNRESVLTEQSWQAIAEAHGFRLLPEDSVAANPAVQFRVQTFEPTEGFKPTKPYTTRLLWRDLDGNDQSKLLLTKAVSVVAIVVQGEAPGDESTPDLAAAHDNAAKRSARRRRAAAPAAERT
jgi:hypothetical protein